MSSSADEKTNSLQTIIADLSAFAVHIDQNDLPVLARMQALCQRLANDTAGQPRSATISAQASSLAGDMEELMLHQSLDAAQCSAIADSVKSLSQLVADVLSSNQDADDDEQPRSGVDQVSASECDGTPSHAEPPAAGGNEPSYRSEPLTIKGMDLDFVKAFVEEAGEHIVSIECALLEVERTPTNLDRISDLYQPFYTIRGMSGFLHLRDINCLTQEVETLLDQIRKGKRTMTRGLIDLLLNVVDIVKAQIVTLGACLAKPADGEIPQPPVAQMIHLLREVVAGRAHPGGRTAPPASAGCKTGETLVQQGAVAKEVVDFAIGKQRSGCDEKKIGEILMGMGAVNARQVSQALRAQNPPTETGS